ncbi:hypothetical protein BC826DRAFT_533700 [Russula brevipes]|nr:hypothetical protein BC826DRAFT_533700 [Russula brevipes]
MASNKINVLVAPQPSLQPTVTALRPRPHPPNPAAATLVKRTGRTASPMPSWLRPMNRESRPNRQDTTRSTSSAVGSGRTTLPNHDRTQTQPHSSAPRHESEPPPAARDIVFTSPAPARDHQVACAPKRKAPVVAPRDEEQRDRPLRYAAANLNGRGGAVESRGGPIWIGEDEGERIRMEASMTGREIHSTTKRARRAAAPDDDNDGEFFPSSCPSECSDS